MLTDADILDALRGCFDARNPAGQPLNLAEMGMVEQIVLSLDLDAPGAGIPGVPARQSLHLTLLVPSDDEDRNATLRAQVENLLAGMDGLSRTFVELLASPVWTPDRITPKGRSRLRLDPPAFPILNNRRR